MFRNRLSKALLGVAAMILVVGGMSAFGRAAPPPWQRGVDPFAHGVYHDQTVYNYGINGPGVTLLVRDKQAWPQVQLAGLGTYTFVFYGAERDEWGKRLAAFGTVAGHPSVQPRQAGSEVTWNHRVHTYTWDEPSGPRTMSVGASSLFPGLVVHSDTRELTLFGAMPKQPPSHLAHAETSEIKITRVGFPETPHSDDYVRIDGARMCEPWVLAWFVDSQGMKDVRYGGTLPAACEGADVPWLLILEHQPEAILVGGYGLRLCFRRSCGTVVALPLFGRILQARETTQRWEGGLPAEVLRRIRFWTAVSREMPFDCREEFWYDAPTGVLAVRDVYQYRRIEDDWNTTGRRIAPLSPAVGICRMYRDAHRFPLEFDEPIQEADYWSQWGPYCFVGDADTVAYRVRIGKYLNETLTRAGGRSERAERIAEELDRRVEALAARPPTLRQALWSPNENGAVYIGTTAEQVVALSRCWPWLSRKRQEELQPLLRRLCVERLLAEDHWEQVGTAFGIPARRYRYKQARLECWMDWQYTRVLYALWAYAHHTGDWAIVQAHWPLLQSALASYGVQHEFASLMSGTSHVPLRLHCGINGSIGAARMARRLGDAAWEQRAAYFLGQGLLAWFAQWKGPNYLQHCEPREAEWHALGCYRGLYRNDLPRGRSANGTYLNSRTQSWYPAQGFTWCSDPTLFSAPWSEIFLEAGPELLRFFDDYFRDDVKDQFDYVFFLWPLMFSDAFSYQTGLGAWGMASPYFRVAAAIKRESPQQLEAWLPDAQCAEDPFYLENLLALLHADGQTRWEKLPDVP